MNVTLTEWQIFDIIIVSAILPRRDKLKEKGTVVNKKTKELCLEKNIYFLDHRNFNPKHHLNGNKLHPNKKDSGILAFNFLQYFNNIWLVNNEDSNSNSEKKSKNETVNKNLCDSATISNNRNKVDKSFSDDCDWGSTDSLTSDSRADGKFTVFEHLRKRKFKNMNGITIAQINIDSLRNKFSFLCEAVRGNIDILLVTETKLNSSFPSAQFQMQGYTTPYRLDRNANGGGLLFYVTEDIPSKKIDNVDFDTGLEAMFI